MAKGYTTRKLEVFALHARKQPETVDYEELFKHLSGLPDEDRQLELSDRLIAIPTLELAGHKIWLVAYEGAVGVNPLIFDASQATARIQKLKSGEIVASKTHALIDLKERIAIVEYNHRGAKANDISRVLESAARNSQKFTTISIDLNPFVDEEFSKAISRFDRIRLASLRVARPNIDWTDHYDNLTQVAEDSDARLVEISLTANRGESLSLKGGIIKFIRDLVKDKLSMLKGAKVIGVRTGEASETTVSIAHHVEHQKINIRMTSDGHVDENDIRKKMEEYLKARSTRNDPK